ncbi:MAG: DUF2804 family protein [Nocardia sp.]|nr:DUF2804 family protein [Nocardia sp.]
MLEPTKLVHNRVREYGRFGARPTTVNPLAEFSGLGRVLRRHRLKEWVGFTLIHPELYSSVIVQDAKYLGSSEFYAYDCSSGALIEHDRTAPPGAVTLPAELCGSTTQFDRAGYRVRYDFAPRTHRIEIDIADTVAKPAIRARLEVAADHASPVLSVSSRLPGGRLYTTKAVYPVGGSMRVGEREFQFHPDRDLVILDEHKSFLPYRTRWTWGTFATFQGTSPVGANFADRPEIPGQPEESGIWTPTATEPLDDITFDRTGTEGTPWHIHSRDGRLNVTFTPEGRKSVAHQLGIFAIDYFQEYGTYRGTLDIGKRIDIAGVHGVCEQMKARL